MIDAQAPLLYTPLSERVFSKLQPETASSEAITVPITSGYFFVGQYWQQLKLGDRAEFAKTVSESDIYLYQESAEDPGCEPRAGCLRIYITRP